MPYKDPDKQRAAKRECERRRRALGKATKNGRRGNDIGDTAQPGGKDPSMEPGTPVEPDQLKLKTRNGLPIAPPPLPPGTSLPCMSVKNAEDLVEMLSEQMAIMRSCGQPPLETGRAIAYIASIVLRALETDQLEKRIAELEEVLLQRDRRTEEASTWDTGSGTV